MKLKPGFDDEFQPKGQRCSRPVRVDRLVDDRGGRLRRRLVGHGGNGEAQEESHALHFRGVQRPVQVPQVKAPAAQPRDPFVVVAAAEIDAKMVVPAPAGIDEAMVFNPYSRERQPAHGAPASRALLAPVPDDQPGQAPYDFDPPESPWPARPQLNPTRECACPSLKTRSNGTSSRWPHGGTCTGCRFCCVVVDRRADRDAGFVPRRAPGGTSSRTVRRIGLIHCALAIQALMFLVQELLTIRTMGIPESHVGLVGRVDQHGGEPSSGDRPLAPAGRWLVGWRLPGTRSCRCSPS